MAGEDRKKQMEKLIDRISYGLYERREHVAVSLLATLAGHNVFLLGPPGTAKSMLARRLRSVFAGKPRYFEYLMQRFSTPEEIFGPVSLAELKNDNYMRKTEGFLPEADIAFLDEIWKSSPAILNTLLTIINEKTFRNGTKINKVPLKSLIAASNETPPPKQGLEALYDRFIVRLHVPPMQQMKNFEHLLTDTSADDVVNCDSFAVSEERLKNWRKGITCVKLSDETIEIIKDIRLQLASSGEKEDVPDQDLSVSGDDNATKIITKDGELKIYVSDRRWQKAAMLLKAAAYFCGRQYTNLADTLLLRHCLWTNNDDRDAVAKMVEEAVEKCGFVTEISSEEVDSEKNDLKKDIDKTLLVHKNSYEIFKLRDKKEYYKGSVDMKDYNGTTQQVEFYIPASKMKIDEEFHPKDDDGDYVDDITCCFKGQDRYSVITNSAYNKFIDYKDGKQFETEELLITPKILIKEGTRKEDVHPSTFIYWNKKLENLRTKYEDIIVNIEKKKHDFEREMDTPFVPEDVRKIALLGIEEQMERVRQERMDCDKLLSMIKE